MLRDVNLLTSTLSGPVERTVLKGYYFNFFFPGFSFNFPVMESIDEMLTQVIHLFEIIILVSYPMLCL